MPILKIRVYIAIFISFIPKLKKGFIFSSGKVQYKKWRNVNFQKWIQYKIQ